MTHFINVFTNGILKDNFSNYSFSLFSGESVKEIKERIIEDLNETYSLLKFISPELLNPDLSSAELNANIEALPIDNFHMHKSISIMISQPFTDLTRALDHYSDYLNTKKTEPWHTTEVGFYFNGDFAESTKNEFPYLLKLYNDFNVKVTTKYANKTNLL